MREVLVLKFDNQYIKSAVSFCEYSRSAKSMSELKSELSELLRVLAFDFYIFSPCHNIMNDIGKLVVSNLSADHIEVYLNSKKTKINPILKYAAKRLTSFEWSDPDFINTLDVREHAFFSELDACGMAFGYTVPLHFTGVTVSAVSFISDKYEAAIDVKQAVTLIASAFLEASIRINTTKTATTKGHGLDIAGKLSPREQECLYWVSMGKTDSEIASILKLAEGTVHAHVEGAKRRMGVHTRIEAVLRAYFTNQIHL
jgi:DNA-binding CsgD family transcriptional regulator